MAPKPNPQGMTRRRMDDSQPPHGYEILDGDQVVGQSERIELSREQYWRAYPAGGSPAPRDFPLGTHQDRVMPWLRDPWAAGQ